MKQKNIDRNINHSNCYIICFLSWHKWTKSTIYWHKQLGIAVFIDKRHYFME